MSEAPVLVGEELVADVKTLRSNSWNPNVMSEWMFERERASIRTFGFVDSILVRRIADSGDGVVFEIIDGEHRWKAAQLEGMDRVKVNDLGPISDAKAQQLTIILNETRGDPDKVKLAALVKRIVEADEGARDVLPYESDEIRRMVEITDFDWSKLDGGDPTRSGDASRASETTHKLTFAVTTEQLPVIQRALHAARTLGQVPSDNLALELICADYLGGAPGEVPFPPPDQPAKRRRRRKTEDAPPEPDAAS